ncbi:peptidase M3A and M3B thimet/oligopeptidase F [Neobacillus notoginsengisoli]|uniref:Peptidase M3A and M3B thimet/oligopeptidase F n=1 Tax=Neobacillus notoginsengisoli TaxID=1578198 RepID=A0A417YS36_9BACI|nr:M2 family metallopeptidase [Neobacillus notoginsengisoli]RHW38102.1 peptidase M3A and M3B thimet/oligopeptidase F [Neobacillus notoginsengisoli]
MESLEQFLRELNEKMKLLTREVTEASWKAQTTGDPEWAEKLTKASTAHSLFFANKDTYENAQQFLQQDGLDLVQKRELEVFVNNMKSKQLPEEILADLSKRSAELNLRFNTYSPEVDGKAYSANDIRDVLMNSEDLELRKKVWYASKEVGAVVEKDLLKLVGKRNEAARLLGYDNYHQMAFDLQELDRDEVFSIFRKLVEQSDETYRTMKAELDERLAAKFGIDVSEIRPWHYVDPFFQEAPPSEVTNLDRFYKGKDLVQLTTDTFNEMGIEVTDLYGKSDLYPRDKKNPTAFCTDMDRAGDVRVLCNLTESAYWMETNLHEFGHAAYFKYVDDSLPFSLHTYSHILTTEAIAMLFGKMGKDPRWLKQFLQLDEATVAELTPELEKYQQLQMLIAARWTITFVFFEKELYENPEQDLNSLWWKTVQEIQLVTPPDEVDNPDWAAKIHFTLAPVYYQNYALGELVAAQLQRYIERNVSPEFFTEETGKLLIESFFKPGALSPWNEKTLRVTGEKLNPQYFAELYC